MSTSNGHGRRRAGSVRFDPYYKIQWFLDRSLAWRDVQQRFDTIDDAIGFATANPIVDRGVTATRGRVMRITMTERNPVTEFVVTDGTVE